KGDQERNAYSRPDARRQDYGRAYFARTTVCRRLMSTYLLLIAAALGAGLMNAVAGGGSFLTFPALVFTGVPSIVANATSTVALFPGALASAWAYRREFKSLDKIPLKPALIVSIAGGIFGALLLLFTSQKTFDIIIPWLLLAATVTFAVGPRLMRAFK